jgi:mannose-6-phosphate isomerase-like protein (cupin superfamily)
MPVIFAADAPTFKLAEASHTVFTGLASPSRGAHETSVWRVALAPGTPSSTPHSLDHEEILVALAGRAVASIAGSEYAISPGDAIIVPAGAPFSLQNPHPAVFEALAVLPVGARAKIGPDAWFTPPWAV